MQSAACTSTCEPSDAAARSPRAWAALAPHPSHVFDPPPCTSTTPPPPPPPPAFQTTATEAHVRTALDLFRTSTMDAVKSGLMDVMVFTDEQRCAQGWEGGGGGGLPLAAARRGAWGGQQWGALGHRCMAGSSLHGRGRGGAGRQAQPLTARPCPPFLVCPLACVPPCRQEVHRVEEQIRRRVAIGSFVSERRLVDELVRCGGGGGERCARGRGGRRGSRWRLL